MPVRQAQRAQGNILSSRNYAKHNGTPSFNHGMSIFAFIFIIIGDVKHRPSSDCDETEDKRARCRLAGVVTSP